MGDIGREMIRGVELQCMTGAFNINVPGTCNSCMRLPERERHTGGEREVHLGK